MKEFENKERISMAIFQRHPEINKSVEICHIPSRFVNAESARLKFGSVADRLAPYLMYGDPLADKLVHRLHTLPSGQGEQLVLQAMSSGIQSIRHPPKELVNFFENVERVPLWVDWEQLAQGGAAILRAGHLALLVLGCYALPLSYSSPDGNKPLMYTRKLIEMASRRLIQTANYVLEVCRPDGLQQGNTGYRISIRVRLMHAQVRRLLLRKGNWQLNEWGLPINQADMLGTNLLFSIIMVDGLKKLGFQLSNDEIEAIISLWRYAGFLIGIEGNIGVTSFKEGWRIVNIIRATNNPANEDSILLVNALRGSLIEIANFLPNEVIDVAKLQLFLMFISRYLLGDELADQLHIEKNHYSIFLPPVFGGVSILSYFSKIIPCLHELAIKEGVQTWEKFTELSKHFQ